jgi:hypothetical protein
VVAERRRAEFWQQKGKALLAEFAFLQAQTAARLV